MATEARTEHPHVVVVKRAGGDHAVIRGTGLPVSLIAVLFNRGETPVGLLSLYPNLTPSALYDAISYYFDHKVDIDREIDRNDPDRVLAELRQDPELMEVSPGTFRRKKASRSGD